jgi:thiol-disulfide isomerase/thioredoxin
MRHPIIIFCLLLSTLSYSQRGETYQQQQARQKASIGKTFPSFKAQSGDDVLTQDSLKNKVVFINFWFESCLPCMAEMKGLNQLYDSLKNNEGFEFVSFTYDKPDIIKKIKEKYGIKYTIYSISNSECAKLNQGNGFPTNIILSQDLKIIHLKSGGAINVDQATRDIMEDYYPILINELIQ